jgi:hypothetical protein
MMAAAGTNFSLRRAVVKLTGIDTFTTPRIGLMPRDGSLVLSGVRLPTLAIVCTPCAGFLFLPW